jgi:hypothetical protein
MESLLGEFRRGNIADKDRTQEALAIRTHLGAVSALWDHALPPFPACTWKRRSFASENSKGIRDTYIERLTASVLAGYTGPRRLIVNQATVFGRHARALSYALPTFEVLGTDITPLWNFLYGFVSHRKWAGLKNYRFVRENIFHPKMEREPAVVTFFGACGSLTDGCFDYAVALNTPFIICRSCCHENIADNTVIVRRPGLLNFLWSMKNGTMGMYKKLRPAFSFSGPYLQDSYPRSKSARRLMDADTALALAQSSVDSDICRSLIDLDRCMYLQEHGYDVLYREEVFFAHKREEDAILD